MQRHGRGGGLSSLRPRTRTPYERPPPGMDRRRRSSANEDLGVADEPKHDAVAAQTPGLLSRVRSMLSPAKLWSPGRRSKLSGVGPAPAAEEEQTQDPDKMNDGEPVQQPITPFKFPAPGDSLRRPSSLSRDSIVDSARRDSPNEKLRQFFMAKGDDKLTEMEVEGVMSLIRQAKEQNESAIDIDVVSGSSSAAASGPATPSQPLRNRKSLPQFSTPVAAQSRSPATYTPRYGSSASSSAASSAAKKDTEASKAATPSIRYMDIPTPYRPARRSSPLRQSSMSEPGSAQPESASQPEPLSAQSASENDQKPAEPAAPKPMSQTASVLLSLLDEGDDKPEEPPKPEAKPFVSPYAASPRRATPVRRRESAESPKKSPLQQLEHARPKQATTASGPTAVAGVTSSEATAKYKPARSSSLRQSIVIDADSPPAKPLSTSTAPPNATPSNLFKLSPASTALFQPPPQQSQADSQSQDLSPSKPLFHSRSEPNNKPAPRAHAPAQPPSLFSVKPAETAGPAPAAASSSTFGSNPATQPAVPAPPASFSFTKAEPSPSVDSTTSTDTHKDLPAFGFPDVAHVAAPTLSAADIATLERLKSSSFTF